jgi:cellulose biosynthesis protein BcsQ
MYNKSMIEHTEILDKLELSIGKDKILPAVRKDVKLAKAFIEGIPLCKSEPKARGAVDYDILSAHILNKIEGV